MLSMLIACASSQTLVHGSETLPWGVERIRAYCVWDNNMDMAVDEGANAGQYIKIAFIDWGIDYWKDGEGQIHYHPDLEDNVAGGKGFKSLDCHVVKKDDHKDPNGHGTLVAGIIAAVDNDNGVIGTAPKAEIYALKLFTWSPEEVREAIYWAIGHGALIISMSLTLDDDYDDVREACDDAYDTYGRLLIAASGNKNGPVDYPAAYDSVIAVGAVDENDQRWVNPSKPEIGSNFGPELEFVAPGVDVYSTWLDGGYASDTGTSFACPHVAPVAALIWSSKLDPDYDLNQNGFWDNFEVRLKLRHLTLDLEPSGRDNETGFGLINAWATNQRPLGDINNDYTVDIIDVALAAYAYGATPGHPRWDPRADVNIDNTIDITDISIIAKNFGKTDP